ncbi:hypothetical protein ACHAWF_018683 [Thalassiosira exigua]
MGEEEGGGRRPGRGKTAESDAVTVESAFDERLKRKLAEGADRSNTPPSGRRRGAVESDVAADSAFEERLKGKLAGEEGRSRAGKRSGTVACEAAGRLRGTVESDVTANSAFEERLKRKLAGEEEKSHAGKRSGTVASEAAGRLRGTVESDVTAGSAFEERLKGKLAGEEEKSRAGKRSGTVASETAGRRRGAVESDVTADSAFEERLKRKVGEGGADRPNDPLETFISADSASKGPQLDDEETGKHPDDDPELVRRRAVRAVARDASLTSAEKDERIRDIMANRTAALDAEETSPLGEGRGELKMSDDVSAAAQNAPVDSPAGDEVRGKESEGSTDGVRASCPGPEGVSIAAQRVVEGGRKSEDDERPPTTKSMSGSLRVDDGSDGNVIAASCIRSTSVRFDGGDGLLRTSASSASDRATSCSRPSSRFQRFTHFFGNAVPVEATLVEEDDGAVVVAERVGCFERNAKKIGLTAFLFLALSVVLLATFLSKGSTAASEGEAVADVPYCVPCIDRARYVVKAVLHGTSENPFWREYAATMRRVAEDMRVTLDLELFPPGGYDDRVMADAIRSAAGPTSSVDALVVTIPSKIVANAVRYAADRGLTVFGANSGFDLVSEPDQGLAATGAVAFFTAMDERLGGEMAASRFLEGFAAGGEGGADAPSSARERFDRALFVSPSTQRNNSAFEERFNGYRSKLVEASDGIDVEWVLTNSSLNGVKEQLSNCTFQSVLVGSNQLAVAVAEAIREGGCHKLAFPTKLGQFDRSDAIDLLIEDGLMDFTIDQGNHIQSWAPVQLAALYATTGLVPVPPSKGIYLSGPVLFTRKDYPREVLSVCSDDRAFVRSNNGVSSCIPRSNITIGGVVHGTTDEKFWDEIVSAAYQGANDTGVRLIFDRLPPQTSSKTLYEKMSAKIVHLCRKGVHGLFVTLSDNVVVEAVRRCMELNPDIKVLSINAGYKESADLNLIHHVGMEEKDAGYQAGQKLIYMATFDKALCLNDIPKLAVLSERCQGFGQAMVDAGIDYLGEIEVPGGSTKGYDITVVETAAGRSADWGDHVILLSNVDLLPAALELKKLHKDVVIATFDTNNILFEALASGAVLFGIDQAPYLQGYLPISILLHAATTKQSFLDHLIWSGPQFITSPPTKEEDDCMERNFPVCGGALIDYPISPTVNDTVEQLMSSMRLSLLPTSQPSSSIQPSSPPSFDRRPTLEIVQARGHILCGTLPEVVKSDEGFLRDMCRAVAAVVFGDPDKVVLIPVTSATRFIQLNDGEVDLLVKGDTHTVEREVRERTTGAGFTFSTPYFYDGLAFLVQGSSGHDFVQSRFPPRFFHLVSSSEHMEAMLFNGECNVIARDRSKLFAISSRAQGEGKDLFLGEKLSTKSPLAIVTRNSDSEWSDIVNWIVYALFYGEEQGLTKDPSLCHNESTLPHAFDLDFLNAVYCVGNYGEIFEGDTSNRGMNQINNGGTGMLYATPWGNLESQAVLDISGSLLGDIVIGGELNCGVLLASNDKLVGMNIEFCNTLAAALFQGNYEAVRVHTFSDLDDSSFVALSSGKVDVLAGGRIELEYDFKSSSSLDGLHFSTPYFFGNETVGDDVSFYSLVTRDDDVMFSSFVNCIVLAIIFAEEKRIGREDSTRMPLMPTFGDELKWALRDAVAYSGSFDQLYEQQFGDVSVELRGRNVLNRDSGPQLHSFPGLRP